MQPTARELRDILTAFVGLTFISNPQGRSIKKSTMPEVTNATLRDDGAVVVTLREKAAEVPDTIRLFGVTEHELFAGAPVQVMLTTPVKPAVGATWRL